jgi:hypothetical protein
MYIHEKDFSYVCGTLYVCVCVYMHMYLFIVNISVHRHTYAKLQTHINRHTRTYLYIRTSIILQVAALPSCSLLQIQTEYSFMVHPFDHQVTEVITTTCKIIDGQYLAFQRFSSCKQVPKTVESRFPALNYFASGSRSCFLWAHTREIFDRI